MEASDAGVRYGVRVEGPTRERLDRYLAEELSLSRSHIATLIESGRVRIADQVPKKSYIPEPGDLIVVVVPPPEPTAVLPEDIPIDIVYEDQWLLVVNKPAGMVVHPAPGHRGGTVVNALLHRVGELSPVGGAHRPGIVHRLDKYTSGLLIVAREGRAHRRLADALSRRAITRRYLAACWGHLARETLRIEATIGRSRRDRKRMAVVPGVRPAITELERLEVWRSADYVRVQLQTGRTHQIRVHLRHIGHPVVGDREYGAGWERGLSGSGRRWATELAVRVQRQFLHATELGFDHPISGRRMEFKAPLPAELAAAVEWARRTS